MKKMTALLLLAFANATLAAVDNVHLSGTLVAEPCTLVETDTDIQLDFGTVISKYLYQYQRSKSQPFTLHLLDCNPSLGNMVNVTFQGTPDTELNQLLALDTASTAKGIAIGIEQEDGKPLAINKSSVNIPLASGNNALSFRAYAQIQPSALTNQTLTVGSFTAISTFVLSYE